MCALGLPSNRKSSQQLRRACELAMTDERRLLSIKKVLYQQIADEFETAVECVDISIRRAFRSIWDMGSRKMLKDVMGRPLTKPPRSSEFPAAAYRCLDEHPDMKAMTLVN